jgi:hypothetical protein
MARPGQDPRAFATSLPAVAQPRARAALSAGWLHDARMHAAVIAACYGLWILVVDPRGEFALNDDWAYALPVQILVERGVLRLTFFQGMPLLAQIAWGVPFCLPLGFSFTALRVSTLVLGLLGMLGVYRLLRDRDVAPLLCLLAALGLLANPVYATLANTFMTDVPFFAAFVWSAVFLLRALTRAQSGALLLGMGLAVFATLIRQIGVLLPVAFAIASLRRSGFGRHWAREALLPLVCAAAVLPLSRALLAHSVGLPVLYDERNVAVRTAVADLIHGDPGVLRLTVDRTLQLVLYSGLWLAPSLCPLLARAARAHPRALLRVAVLGSALAAALFAADYAMPRPMFGNILLELGVGPRTLPGAPMLPSAALRVAMTVTAALGAAALLYLLAPRLREVARGLTRGTLDLTVLFAGVALVLGFAPFALVYGPFFDRYLLALLPLLLLLLLGDGGATGRGVPRRALLAGFACVLGGALYTAAAVHDYLAWNRARWTLAAELSREGLPGARLDAGFEHDNYFVNRDALRRDRPRSWLIDRDGAPYALRFAPEPADTVLRSVPTHAWLPYAPARVVLVRRGDLRHRATL